MDRSHRASSLLEAQLEQVIPKQRRLLSDSLFRSSISQRLWVLQVSFGLGHLIWQTEFGCGLMQKNKQTKKQKKTLHNVGYRQSEVWRGVRRVSWRATGVQMDAGACGDGQKMCSEQQSVKGIPEYFHYSSCVAELLQRLPTLRDLSPMEIGI